MDDGSGNIFISNFISRLQHTELCQVVGGPLYIVSGHNSLRSIFAIGIPVVESSTREHLLIVNIPFSFATYLPDVINFLNALYTCFPITYNATINRLAAMKYVTAFDPVLVRPSIIGTVRVCVAEAFHKFVLKPEKFLL